MECIYQTAKWLNWKKNWNFQIQFKIIEIIEVKLKKSKNWIKCNWMRQTIWSHCDLSEQCRKQLVVCHLNENCAFLFAADSTQTED